jgi:hypothetical protein
VNPNSALLRYGDGLSGGQTISRQTGHDKLYGVVLSCIGCLLYLYLYLLVRLFITNLTLTPLDEVWVPLLFSGCPPSAFMRGMFSYTMRLNLASAHMDALTGDQGRARVSCSLHREASRAAGGFTKGYITQTAHMHACTSMHNTCAYTMHRMLLISASLLCLSSLFSPLLHSFDFSLLPLAPLILLFPLSSSPSPSLSSFSHPSLSSGNRVQKREITIARWTLCSGQACCRM